MVDGQPEVGGTMHASQRALHHSDNDQRQPHNLDHDSTPSPANTITTTHLHRLPALHRVDKRIERSVLGIVDRQRKGAVVLHDTQADEEGPHDDVREAQPGACMHAAISMGEQHVVSNGEMRLRASHHCPRTVAGGSTDRHQRKRHHTHHHMHVDPAPNIHRASSSVDPHQGSRARRAWSRPRTASRTPTAGSRDPWPAEA